MCVTAFGKFQSLRLFFLIYLGPSHPPMSLISRTISAHGGPPMLDPFPHFTICPRTLSPCPPSIGSQIRHRFSSPFSHSNLDIGCVQTSYSKLQFSRFGPLFIWGIWIHSYSIWFLHTFFLLIFLKIYVVFFLLKEELGDAYLFQWFWWIILFHDWSFPFFMPSKVLSLMVLLFHYVTFLVQ